jgi:Flp pilus assembly pilin Flp
MAQIRHCLALCGDANYRKSFAAGHPKGEALTLRIWIQATLLERPFWAGCQRLWQDEIGQDLIEYALIGCLLALSAIASIKPISHELGNYFNSISSNLNNAV